MVSCERIIGGRVSLFTVKTLFITRPGIHEVEFMEIVLNVGVDFTDDLLSHFVQFDHSVGAWNPVFLAVRNDGLAKAHRIAPLVDVFGIVISGSIMEV